MKIKFKATKAMRGYNGKGLQYITDGNEAEVTAEIGNYLLKTFPDNFTCSNPMPRATDMATESAPTDLMHKGSEKKGRKNRK